MLDMPRAGSALTAWAARPAGTPPPPPTLHLKLGHSLGLHLNGKGEKPAQRLAASRPFASAKRGQRVSKPFFPFVSFPSVFYSRVVCLFVGLLFKERRNYCLPKPRASHGETRALPRPSQQRGVGPVPDTSPAAPAAGMRQRG